MSQSKTPNDIEAFIRRTDIETQQLRTRSPASTVHIPHITLLPDKDYSTPPNKKYEEAMSKALEKNQQPTTSPASSPDLREYAFIYTEQGRLQYVKQLKQMQEAMKRKYTDRLKEVTAEVVPSYQDLDQRLTTVENMLGLRQEEKKRDEEEKLPACLEDVFLGQIATLFALGFIIGILYLVMIS